jgi:hypothetical protein
MISCIKHLRTEKKIVIISTVLMILTFVLTSWLVAYLFYGIALGYTLFLIDEHNLNKKR